MVTTLKYIYVCICTYVQPSISRHPSTRTTITITFAVRICFVISFILIFEYVCEVRIQLEHVSPVLKGRVVIHNDYLWRYVYIYKYIHIIIHIYICIYMNIDVYGKPVGIEGLEHMIIHTYLSPHE
jgi:hypothetical protein